MKYTHRRAKNRVLWLFLVFSFTNAFPHEPQYGLQFRAYSYEPEMRTSLDLSPDDFITFPDGFSLDFDVKFAFKEVQSYGYVFRMTDRSDHKIDLVLSDKSVSFSSSPGNIILIRDFAEVKLVPDQWMKVRLDVNREKSELKVRIGNLVQQWEVPEVRAFRDVRVVFGKNNYHETHAVDVPDMTLRDVKLEDREGVQYHWKLAKHTPDGVYDELKHRFARCEHPNWVLMQNTVWKKESTFTCGENSYIAYNPDENVIAVADRQFFYRFSLNDKQLRKRAISRGLAYPRYANQMIYNPADARYYAYNLVKEGDAREFAAFHPAAGAWAETTPHNHYSDYWHHNRYFSVRDNVLYLFGGYGHHKYKRDVFRYRVSTGEWSQHTLAGDSIEPRYLSGLGVLGDNRLLRFGGYGSESGNQELSPRHYYDAYSIDLETLSAKKIWTLDAPEENFVVSNSLVTDTANNCFYALCYPFTRYNTTVVLYRFSLTEPVAEALADTISLGFKDAGSFVDLFLDRANRQLVAVTSSGIAKDSLASISIYSLSYPPFKKEDLYQPVPVVKKTWGMREVSFAAAALIALVLLVYFGVYFVTRKPEVPEVPEEEEEEGSTGITSVKSVRKQAIFLFGGFQVIDANARDLTAWFKPLVKNLFLLILLHTIKNGKGISFRKLKEILWFDMTEENANNNRGVAMSKIRQIMKHVGEIRFLKQGVYWLIEFGTDIYCDYFEALVLMRKIKESPVVGIKDLKRLLAIVSEGELLPNIQIDWADSFKSDFSNDFIDLILPLMTRKDRRFSDALFIDMANAVFIHDRLNEDALRLKCSLLVKTGKNGLAKNTYTAFVKEYAAWFATEYKYSFDQVIG
ncbi:MAG: hypothetical protein LBH61_03655 [Dysgonamonadaceae bacterium]|nr:hypothetical protein [Dysgonamonadaceae bacterium]